jgi:hypothetical protein
MKQRLKPIIMYSILMAIFITIPGFIFAQGGDPGCDPICNCRADGTICPIDDGLYALLAIGIGYGIIKVRKQKKLLGKTVI